MIKEGETTYVKYEYDRTYDREKQITYPKRATKGKLSNNHPLFTQDMKIYSDSTVSDFLHSITQDQSAGFLNEWNGTRNHREKIYISYDSTNKNSQAGDVEIVEYGKARVDMRFPVFNYAVGYNVNNREPLFYEKYPGSIVDISQLKLMPNKEKATDIKI